MMLGGLIMMLMLHDADIQTCRSAVARLSSLTPISLLSWKSSFTFRTLRSSITTEANGTRCACCPKAAWIARRTHRAYWASCSRISRGSCWPSKSWYAILTTWSRIASFSNTTNNSRFTWWARLTYRPCVSFLSPRTNLSNRTSNTR